MRTPSTLRQLYRWHSLATRGEEPPRHDGFPECGWFKTRLVTGGPWIPVEIVIDREIDPLTGELVDDERMIAVIEDERRPAEGIWLSLRPITRDEFDAINEQKRSNPAMSATKVKIDLTASPMRP